LQEKKRNKKSPHSFRDTPPGDGKHTNAIAENKRGDENATDKQKHATQTQRTQSNARNNTQQRKGKEQH
jgi:hypothetical protein